MQSRITVVVAKVKARHRGETRLSYEGDVTKISQSYESGWRKLRK